MTAERRLFMDVRGGNSGPATGDIVVTVGQRGYGSYYLVLDSRRIQRRDPQACPRYELHVQIVDATWLGERVWTLRWYGRGRRRGAPITLPSH